MKSNRINLNILEVARPCPADWNAMAGDDQVRFCGHCSLHVYNISEMDRDSAERLVAEHEGHLCLRMYRRLDGTVITADCGGGLRLALRRAGGRVAAMAGVAVAFLAAVAGFDSRRSPTTLPAMKGDPIPEATMGAMMPIPLMPSTRPSTQPVPQVLGRISIPPIRTPTDGSVITGFVSPRPTTVPDTK